MSPVNVNAIGAYIREQREQAKISLRQLAQATGVSNPYLSQVERGLRRPSADILQQIAKGLRISAEALYVQAGILDDRPPGSGVREAVLGDPELNERQKQMLLEVYDSFRKENASGGSGRTVLIGETVPEDQPALEDEAGLEEEAALEAQAALEAEAAAEDLAREDLAREDLAGEDLAGEDQAAGGAPAGPAASADEGHAARQDGPSPGPDQVA
jgi:transcriptional regulator with XRE-family HTH domain